MRVEDDDETGGWIASLRIVKAPGAREGRKAQKMSEGIWREPKNRDHPSPRTDISDDSRVQTRTPRDLDGSGTVELISTSPSSLDSLSLSP